MKAKLVNENLNESSFILKLNNEKLFSTGNKKKMVNYLIALKNERPTYFEESKLFIDNVSIRPEQFIFINKNNEEENIDILLDIYKKVKDIVKDKRIYFFKPSGHTSNSAILIAYKDISEKEKEKLFKTFDVETDDFYITDDAGPNAEYIGIYLNDGENFED